MQGSASSVCHQTSDRGGTWSFGSLWKSLDVTHSDWAAPIVAVQKKDGKFRLCGDYKKVMDMILQGIPNVICYIGNILVTGSNDADHLKNLEEVLRRLQQHGTRMKLSKSCYMQDSVEYRHFWGSNASAAIFIGKY